MNRFFSHLIDRHQTFGEQQKNTPKVQPRPKSRFESEPVSAPTVDNTRNNEAGAIENQPSSTEMETNSTEMLDSLNLSSLSPLLAGQQNQMQSSEKLTDSKLQPIDDGSKSMEAITVKLNQQPSVQEQGKGTLDTQHLAGIETIPDPDGTTDKPTTHAFSLQSGINSRIEDILLRLQHSTTANTANTENKGDARQPDRATSVDSTPVEMPVSDLPHPLFVSAEITPKESVHLAKEDTTTDSDQANKQTTHPSGLLQTPNWLAQRQADINQRWQQSNTHAATEPVVNVTIGRIEVRAIQTEKKQHTTPKKPSGVMSLDAYLKQRESRGRA